MTGPRTTAESIDGQTETRPVICLWLDFRFPLAECSFKSMIKAFTTMLHIWPGPCPGCRSRMNGGADDLQRSRDHGHRKAKMRWAVAVRQPVLGEMRGFAPTTALSRAQMATSTSSCCHIRVPTRKSGLRNRCPCHGRGTHAILAQDQAVFWTLNLCWSAGLANAIGV